MPYAPKFAEITLDGFSSEAEVTSFYDGDPLLLRVLEATGPIQLLLASAQRGKQGNPEYEYKFYPGVNNTGDPDASGTDFLVSPDRIDKVTDGLTYKIDIRQWHEVEPGFGFWFSAKQGTVMNRPAIRTDDAAPGVTAPTLAALTLSASTVSEDAAIGTLVDGVQGRTAGSALTLPDDASGRFAIDTGTGEIRVAAALDYETATSHNITVRETLSGASNSPRDTVLTISVADVDETPAVVAPTAAGALSDLTLAQGSGVQTYTTASDFADGGGALSFSLPTAPSGVTIDAATGIVSIDTGATGALSGSSVVVRATNSADSADSAFSLTVAVFEFAAQTFTIEVNPPSGYSPADLFASGEAGQYYEPTAGSVTLNGSTVSQMDDLSGNGNHATQGAAALQPGFSEANGLTFDGTDDVMSLPSLSATSYTLCVGVVPGATGVYFLAGSTSSDSKLGTLNGEWFLRSSPAGSSITGGSVSGGQPYVVTVTRDGTTHSLRVNGAVIGSGSTGSSAAIWDVLGEDNGGATWLGDVRSFLLIDRALSGAELTDLETHVSSLMGVTL